MTARTVSGTHTAPLSEDARAWCLSGAITKVYGTSIHGEDRSVQIQNAVSALTAAIVDMGSGESVITFNDCRSFDQVLDLVRRAGV